MGKMGGALLHCQSQKGRSTVGGIFGCELHAENSRFRWFAADQAGFRINLQAGWQAFRSIDCRRIAGHDLVGEWRANWSDGQIITK